MQTATYSITSGETVALWRGIPAQITISGIEDVSGDWLFLVDNDLADGVILSGTVAADGETLVVTLENMNTVELAAVIQGRQTLQCRATLTDGASRVYLIPLTVRNRAIEGTPTPVSEYYTKAQVDALIAAIPTGTTDYDELTDKPQINGHTLTGDQTAAELVLVSVNGMPSETLTDAATVAIPGGGKIYELTVAQDTALQLPTPAGGCYFWLYIHTAATAHAVTFPAGIEWDGEAPVIGDANSLYRLAFLYDVPTQKWLASQFWPATQEVV